MDENIDKALKSYEAKKKANQRYYQKKREIKQEDFFNRSIEMAISKGGECLSKEYKNSKEKLEWKCAEEHTFLSTYSSVQQGSWCLRCKINPSKDMTYLRHVANEKGGKCLSNTYKTTSDIYLWECAKGHQWESSYDSVRYGTWCKKCRETTDKAVILERIHKIAQDKKGKCLSESYVNNKNKMNFECSKGHQWWAISSSILSGRWCQTCFLEKRRNTLEYIQLLAKANGCECLSKNYNRETQKLAWKCSKGHTWESSLANVKRGTWCQLCKGKTHTLDMTKNIIDEKGGKCLTTSYKVGDRLQVKCSKGHEFETTFSRIKSGWCLKCAVLNRMDTLENAQKYAEKKGGKCLSTEYSGIVRKMDWICAKWHKWRATFHSIKKGTWCPYCSSFRSEEACREIFESLFETKFPKRRPKFLNRLELDGYNEDIQLAFEYQGIQHYKYRPFFHISEEGFKDQQERDRRKYDLCIQNGITLVLIPYTFGYNNLTKLEIYIIDQCISHGIKNEMETIINFIE